MFEGSGRLKYDPSMDGMKVIEPFWLILECCGDISNYYAHMLYKWNGTKIHRPAWGTHISVIRNEKLQNTNLWKLNNGQKVKFLYDHVIQTNGNHYWLQVESPELMAIRKQYGLGLPYHPFHLTIGSLID